MTALGLRDRYRRLRDNPLRELRRMARLLHRRLSDLPFEAALGVDTAAIVHDRADGERQQCEPIPYATLRAMERHMTAHPAPRRFFADIGCGLGRPLYYFAARFEILQGYEISQVVYDAARSQLIRVQRRRAAYRRIALSPGDAVEALPLDRPMTLFLYNPFGPATMTRLCRRLRGAQSDIRIYYAYPAQGEIVARLLAPPRARIHGVVDVAYFHLPGGADAGPKIAPFAA